MNTLIMWVRPAGLFWAAWTGFWGTVSAWENVLRKVLSF